MAMPRRQMRSKPGSGNEAGSSLTIRSFLTKALTPHVPRQFGEHTVRTTRSNSVTGVPVIDAGNNAESQPLPPICVAERARSGADIIRPQRTLDTLFRVCEGGDETNAPLTMRSLINSNRTNWWSVAGLVAYGSAWL